MCTHCGYDISGTVPSDDGRVTCPECGHELVRSTRKIYTKRDVHSHILKLLGLSCIPWSVLTLLFALPPLRDTVASGLAVLIFIMVYPITLLILVITLWAGLHNRTEPHPRPYPRWMIPLWICAYAIPSALVYAGVLFLMERML
jgi:uncharacterized paraquat-inducible protein A